MFISTLFLKRFWTQLCDIKSSCLIQIICMRLYGFKYSCLILIMIWFPGSGRVDTVVWMHYLDANKTAGEETRRQLHKNVANNIEQVLAATPHKAPTIRTPASHHENYPNQTNQICRTLLEKQGRAHKWYTPMDPYIWPSKSRKTSSNIHTAALWGYGM